MKLFQVIQKNFEVLGISPNQRSTNGKLVATSLIYGLSITSSAVFLFFEAESFLEYTSNIYITTAIGVICTYFIIWLIKLEKFFKFIENLESFFGKSKCFVFERRTILFILKCVYFITLNTENWIRIWKYIIQIDLWQNWPFDWEMLKNWVFCYLKSDSRVLDLSEGHHKLFQVLHDEFG